MKNIYYQNKEKLDGVVKFNLLSGKKSEKVSDIPDSTTLVIGDAIVYDDDEKNVRITAFRTSDDKYYATNSKTFASSFLDVAVASKEEGFETFAIEKLSGTSKNGRPFVDCTLFSF